MADCWHSERGQSLKLSADRYPTMALSVTSVPQVTKKWQKLNESDTMAKNPPGNFCENQPV